MTGAVMPVASGQPQGSERSQLWQPHLRMLGVAVLVILGLFWRDARDMVVTWWNISTYNHCLLILPILAWQVHQRWPELQKTTPHVWLPGLAWIALGSIAWLLGEAAGVSLARHLGLVMMLQGTVVALLGQKVAKGLLFVLFYSFFLVPFGEEFVPLLQTITADMSMLFLAWANIPAFIDGVFISTPTGYFEVAEACSGVKFLIAMIAYGALVSNICFRSWRRRALFMLMALTVPIIANGIRAFGTIYIAHHTSTDFATGFDHIFYGWFFFAFVLVLVMAIGWPFFDRKIDDALIDGDVLERSGARQSRFSVSRTVLATALIALAPVAWLSATSAQTSALPERIALPEIPGWEVVAYEPTYDWKPRFDGADHQLLGSYRRLSDGQTVDLAIAVFASQEDGREIVGYGQGAFDPDTEWAWSRNLPDVAQARAEQIVAPGPVVRDVLSYYRIGEKLTGSGSAVKLETLKLRLLGGSQHAVAFLVSAERDSEEGPRQKMIDFTKALGPIDKLADELAGLR
ncbi:exosortase A [Parasphingorhabdus marina DSM 22363]|uniref:Exosortase A n=1 Tax=Parasphingorhabdus marina DSM 22363 TaxID=1123272 RepID=A0A1N6F846_9SPHN|nr:exosortase A [Parasphingorhabdus marina]SIN91441.1 exosortase A [Parasphingorhabdus marina DSM 22363]